MCHRYYGSSELRCILWAGPLATLCPPNTHAVLCYLCTCVHVLRWRLAHPRCRLLATSLCLFAPPQNSLSSSIPGALVLPASLDELVLSGNKLQGPLPYNWTLPGQLRTLRLENNELGGIPPGQLGGGGYPGV